jgi:hypothetical protein
MVAIVPVGSSGRHCFAGILVGIAAESFTRRCASGVIGDMKCAFSGVFQPDGGILPTCKQNFAI